jgi:hypothetical protein
LDASNIPLTWDKGMTNANMKLVLLGVTLPGELEAPAQKLDSGEFIIRRVVELSKLSDELKSKFRFVTNRFSETYRDLKSTAKM